jgi:hypothetical protein
MNSVFVTGDACLRVEAPSLKDGEEKPNILTATPSITKAPTKGRLEYRQCVTQDTGRIK